ncbi:glycosyltransferase family 4 protein [Microbacterium sp. ASV49]|uniref:Glycosyltransferase family 4 protein n=1 Tax=Microbacterium candidum TaxID=3041922 RepID=A0ABT7MUZ0_9MICO|nr:glycosyltransferase family 4 protein [Microbacterium sp. ASV49]MDL9978269.1 glycosyltransferase family 4 protein [Microbacterium sp. ASV49]
MNDVVLINNSRETFTRTHSGAIATCVDEMARRAASGGVPLRIVTRRHADDSLSVLEHDRITFLPPRRDERSGVLGRVDRARRRLTGWARPDQWEYAHDVVQNLQAEPAAAVVVNNDPELAVHLRGVFKDVPVIHWFHNLELASDRYRRAFTMDKGITSIAVSGYLARAVEQVYRMTPGAVVTSLNGVDAAAFGTGELRPDRVPVIGFLGRVAVEKGVDTFLEAALILADRGVGFDVQLVGDTDWGEHRANPYSARVAALFDQLRATGVAVRALGHVQRADLPAALAGSDIHVLPSRWDEPCSLALLEGMASGQAIVATATGGTPEVLGGVGSLVPREDARALADAVQLLVESPERCLSMGNAARARAIELSWEASWQRLSDVVAAAEAGARSSR